MQAGVSSEQSLDEIPRMQRRLSARPLAYLSGDYTMKAIADEFGVHYTTVSRAAKTYGSKNSR